MPISVPTFKIKIIPAPTLKMKSLPALTTRVTATGGLQATKENGVVTIEPAYDDLAIKPSVPEDERPFVFMPALDTLTGQHVRISVDTFVQGFATSLVAIGELEPEANTFPYFTGAETAALAPITSFGRSLVDDADAAAARTTLGAQASHANLAAVSGFDAPGYVTLNADGLPVRSPVFDVVAFRADHTGGADASAEIQDAIDAAVSAGGGIVFFPPGDFRFDSQVSLADVSICFRGSGPATRLLINNTTGGIAWEAERYNDDRPYSATFEDFNIVAANGGNAGTAIYAEWKQAGLGSGDNWEGVPGVTVRNVRAHSSGIDSTTEKFAKVLHFKNLYYSRIDGFSSKQTNSTTTTVIHLDNDPSGPGFAGSYGVDFRNFSILGGQYGIHQNGWLEGCYLQPTEIVGCEIGLLFNGPGGTPASVPVLHIVSGHYNNKAQNLKSTDWTVVHVIGGDYYKGIGGGLDQDTNNIEIADSTNVIVTACKIGGVVSSAIGAAGVSMTGTAKGVVQGNTVQCDGADTAFVATGLSCDDILVTGNTGTGSSSSVAAIFISGTDNAKVHDNQLSGWTTIVSNGGSNTNLLHYNNGASSTWTMNSNAAFLGTVSITGTASRLLADLSNATVSDRLLVQTATTNGSTILYAIPNGTNTTSGYGAINNSTPTNSATAQMVVTNTAATFRSAVLGSGTALPLQLWTGGVSRLSIHESTGAVTIPGALSVEGNLAIGNASGDTVTVNSGNWTTANQVTWDQGANSMIFSRTGAGPVATYLNQSADSNAYFQVQNDAQSATFGIDGGSSDRFYFYFGPTAEVFTVSTSSELNVPFCGITVGAPTGGNKGGGTINVATDIYKNNTAYTNPDYVFEHWLEKKIEKFAASPGANAYHGLMPLDELGGYIRATYRLPGAPETRLGIFERADFALEKIEEAQLYILELHERIRKLEKAAW